MVCITFKLKLVGLLGSFFRKKYISQIYVKKILNKLQYRYLLTRLYVKNKKGLTVGVGPYYYKGLRMLFVKFNPAV